MASPVMAPLVPEDRRSAPPFPENPQSEPLRVVTPNRNLPPPIAPNRPVIRGNDSDAGIPTNADGPA
jgi:hypothetical protein